MPGAYRSNGSGLDLDRDCGFAGLSRGGSCRAEEIVSGRCFLYPRHGSSTSSSTRGLQASTTVCCEATGGLQGRTAPKRYHAGAWQPKLSKPDARAWRVLRDEARGRPRPRRRRSRPPWASSSSFVEVDTRVSPPAPLATARRPMGRFGNCRALAGQGARYLESSSVQPPRAHQRQCRHALDRVPAYRARGQGRLRRLISSMRWSRGVSEHVGPDVLRQPVCVLGFEFVGAGESPPAPSTGREGFPRGVIDEPMPMNDVSLDRQKL